MLIIADYRTQKSSHLHTCILQKVQLFI